MMNAAGDGTRALGAVSLGTPRVHLRCVDSTNAHARALALRGAPHGTLVTASEQTAGRGRQGRTWSAPPGRSLLMSLVLRDPPALLSLIAGVAVCDAVRASAPPPRSGRGEALVKWPNDVVLQSRGGRLAKCAGVLVEGRPQEGWAVLGIGVNVAVRDGDLPPELGAASLGLAPGAVETVLHRLLVALGDRLAQPAPALLDAWRERDALYDRDVHWSAGSPSRGGCDGIAAGIDADGRLLVRLADGSRTTLGAGEVHLGLAGMIER